jgi:hypothetical protein
MCWRLDLEVPLNGNRRQLYCPAGAMTFVVVRA